MKNIPRSVADLRPAMLEAESRPIRYTKLEVLDYEPTNARRPETQLALPGSISVLFSRAGSPMLAAIRAAVKSSDGRDQELAPRIFKQFRGREMITIAESVAALRARPVFGDIRYGGATVIANIWAPEDMEVGLAFLPYNGGALAKAGFTLVEHYKEGETAAMEVVLIRHTPPLSKAEAAAMKKVPADQLELNVGHLGPDGACSVVALVAAVVVVAAIVAVGFAVTGVKKEVLREAHLPDEMLRDLSPGSSARELLALRRAILDGRVR